jgi:ActD protein
MQGVLGAFHELDSAIEAIEELKQERFSDITVYTPTPRHEFDHVMAHGHSRVRVFTLIFGLCGVTFGYWIPVWISDYWPIIVGGKPVASWVPYTILGFEVMVLIGGIATAFAMFALAHIPRLTTTVGYDPRFSSGHFGVWVAADPDRTDVAMSLLEKHGAEEVRRER